MSKYLESLLDEDRGAHRVSSKQSPFAAGFFRSKRITDKEKEEFSTQLAVMLQARVSLPMALEILQKQASSEKMGLLVGGLLKEIRSGNSFAKALETRPDVFDSLYVVTAEVGQETGRLSQVLLQLAAYIEKMNALKKKFFQALTYPALVLTVAFLTVTFMLGFIVPAFGEVFKSFQVELPASTQFVLALSDFAKSYGPFVLLGAILLIYITRQSWRTREMRERMERILRTIPVLGDVLTKNLIARFCRTLGTLLESGVSLIEALMITRRIFDTKDIKEEITGIIDRVKQGRAVAEHLMDSKLFPPMVAQMITVGEETSELDEMLLKVAEYYEKEIDGTVATLASVVEPVIIIILGILVAGILVSMYLPMFELVNVFGGT